MRAPSSPVRRTVTLLAALALAALPCLATPAVATDALDEAWRVRIASVQQEVVEAHARAETARNTYQDWRQRKYPRGVRKKELVREVADAEEAVHQAEAKLAALLEDARRQGVSPGVLREFE